MNTTIEEPDRNDPFQNALRAESDYIYVINPSPELLRHLVDSGVSSTPPSANDDGEIVIDGLSATIRVVGELQTLRSIKRDFVLSTRLADLVDAGHLEMVSYGSSEFQSSGTVVVSEETFLGSVMVPVNGTGREVLLDSPGDTDSGVIYTSLDESWENMDEFKLRNPGRHRIYHTLRDELANAELGEGIPEVAAEDYLALLDLLGDMDEIDNEDVGGETLGLLIGAKYNVLLYDIGRWGEDSGVASKATFSREKGRLEDLGLLSMEKVPIDVGRPRLRLGFPEEIDDTSVEGLANIIAEIS